MLYELRTYTLLPGTVGTYMKYHTELGRPIRGDNYGKLVGGWTTEIGPLNQYVHLWQYENGLERERLRGELAKNERWTKEYAPKIRELMIKQESKSLILAPGATIRPPETGGNIYELRTYRTLAGKTNDWLKIFVEALQHRDKYTKCIGVWSADFGTVQEVCHLWAYPDLNARQASRAQSLADPGWQAFVGQSSKLLAEMHTQIMLPTATSPMQ
ncbi:MAG: NIPSNAP family protein [Chloroflexota bacterium]